MTRSPETTEKVRKEKRSPEKQKKPCKHLQLLKLATEFKCVQEQLMRAFSWLGSAQAEQCHFCWAALTCDLCNL